LPGGSDEQNVTPWDLDRSGRGAKTRYCSRLTDEKGVKRYELVVAGAPEIIKSAFSGDSTIEVEIDLTTNKKVWDKRLGAAWQAEPEGQRAIAALDDVPALFNMTKSFSC